MEPLVSIVIPVYRTQAYLAMCMESVLGQTYQNLEIILVDDESPDDCPRLCEDYARQDTRVKVIHRKNGGLSAARNSGLEAAAGAYVTFLDSDDCIAPTMVEHMVGLALKEQADLVKICLVRCYDGAIPKPAPGGYRMLSGHEVLRTIYDVPQQIISACGKLFRRELFESVRFPEGRYYEDEYTTPKLYARADRVVLSESVMYFYMQWDNGSIMRSALTEKKVTDSLDMTWERIGFFGQIGLRDMVKRAEKDHYLKLCALAQQTGNQPELVQVRASLIRQRRQFAWKHPHVLSGALRRGLWKLKQQISKKEH